MSPHEISLIRFASFSEAEVTIIFHLLLKTLTYFALGVCNVYNTEEQVFPQYKSARRLFQKEESEQLEKVMVKKREQNSSAYCAMKASGAYVPPMFIFPRIKLREKPTAGSPSRPFGALGDSG